MVVVIFNCNCATIVSPHLYNLPRAGFCICKLIYPYYEIDIIEFLFRSNSFRFYRLRKKLIVLLVKGIKWTNKLTVISFYAVYMAY